MYNILDLIAQGENICLEFKNRDVRPDSLAREMVAFSNTSGGTVLVGVEDDGTITGVDASKCEEWVTNISRNNVSPAITIDVKTAIHDGKIVLIIKVPKGKDKPYQTNDGKFWIRAGSTNRSATKEELSRLFQQAGLVHFDISPVENSSIKDLNESLLNNYWGTCYQIDYSALEQSERERILMNADILAETETGLVATVGGLLIFGRTPQRNLPQSSLVFSVFKGEYLSDELVDKKEITGTLPEIINDALAKIKLFLPTPSTIEGVLRNEVHTISYKAVREILVNAVCHRDYSIATRKTMIYLFSDRIEVISPGALPNTVTLEKIKTGNSAPRNHLLLKFLDNLKFIDGLGRGIPMVIKEMGARVNFEVDGVLLRVTLLR